MPVRVIQDQAQRVPVKIWDGDGAVPFEAAAIEQVQRVARMPFVFHHVALMPDGHSGIGATVGSVIATKGAVIPAAVGVDLGCGMMAQQTNFRASDLPDDLGALRHAIEAAIPHGRTNNGAPGDRGAWHDVPEEVNRRLEPLTAQLQEIRAKHPGIVRHPATVPAHLGTLGTGNHFVEVCLDLDQRVWILLHSGSRGIGNRIGSYFIEQAKEQAARYFYEEYLPDKDLAYLSEHTPIFKDYVDAVHWAQEYALTNRELMMQAALGALSATLGRDVALDGAHVVNCHHNYISREKHFGHNVIVTRKGAVRAREGDLGIIPGSMGARSFIVRGKGNRESFESCSHGAGRVMSRTAAKKAFSLEDLEAQTAGVECRKDADVIDEIPKAYKRIEDVMAAQADLVEVVAELRQVVCVKG
jgi:tRNA-splicing ligase RtcB